MKYILALDQGTTSSRAILFDKGGSVISMEQEEFLQIFPQPGWVEHNANEIWNTQREVALRAMRRAGASAGDIAGIGITNQRETTVVWDRRTGEPIGNAIVWQDRRTAAFCDKLKRRGLERWIQKKTGLVIDAYFSASKLNWILHNVPNARRLADAGHLAFGTIDSWLVYKLTEGRTHVTDVSNASRTMLMNLKTCAWDDSLLKEFGVPRSMLPEIRSSSEVLGRATGELEGVPIAGIAGDQQAALFGQVCTRPGMVKNTYGTGCFMLMHTGTKAITSRKKLLSTVAWRIKDKTEYALEGSIFIGGAVVQWLRDGLGLIKSSTESETLATNVQDTNGVYVVPAFAGLGAPHWDPYARGVIVGLTRGSNTRHITRAALESIAYQTADLLQAMETDSGVRLKELRVDGGASKNDFLMQFQADILGVDVVRPQVTETTALGAAYLAGLAVGYWKSVSEIASQWSIERRFEPSMRPEQRKQLLKGWSRAVQCAKGWAKDD